MMIIIIIIILYVHVCCAITNGIDAPRDSTGLLWMNMVCKKVSFQCFGSDTGEKKSYVDR